MKDRQAGDFIRMSKEKKQKDKMIKWLKELPSQTKDFFEYVLTLPGVAPVRLRSRKRLSQKDLTDMYKDYLARLDPKKSRPWSDTGHNEINRHE